MYKDSKDVEERNPTAIASRWQTISHDVSKFCGCYEKLKATNPSGWNEEQYISHALDLYMKRDSSNQAFKNLSCWMILRATPKWTIWNQPKQLKGDKGDRKAETLRDQHQKGLVLDSQLSVDAETVSATEHLARPIGSKAAKELERRKRSKGNEYMNPFQQMNEDFIAISKRKADLFEEQMAYNLFSLTPDAPDSIQFFAVKRATLLAQAQAKLAQLQSSNMSEPEGDSAANRSPITPDLEASNSPEHRESFIDFLNISSKTDGGKELQGLKSLVAYFEKLKPKTPEQSPAAFTNRCDCAPCVQLKVILNKPFADETNGQVIKLRLFYQPQEFTVRANNALNIPHNAINMRD
ncbi:hypothetical protein R1sor_010029 [Riccia sorocarpa]|uniref:No apical meristem-associated C-terminal domain-containing protein n=1 Tax=Riccia sorocarpa TaxID=122646 RepID=A0ABD3HWX3_9MARC